MTERPKSNGTAWIVLGTIGLVIALLYLGRLLIGLLMNIDSATALGTLFGLLVFAGFGLWGLLAGLRRRKNTV